MKFNIFEKKNADETMIEVKGEEGNVVSIFVKTQTSDKALALFKELKNEVKK